MKIKIKYQVSDKEMQDILIETGQQAQREHTLTLDLADLTPDERRRVLEHPTFFHGYSEKSLDLRAMTRPKRRQPYTKAPHIEYSTEGNAIYLRGHTDSMTLLDEYDAIQQSALAVDEALLVEVAKEVAEYYKAAPGVAWRNHEFLHPSNHIWDEERWPAIYEAYEGYKARCQEYTRKKEAREDAERERQAANKQAYAEEREAWIAAHGSEHLRLAEQEGYENDRLYVIERAAREHPAFEVDYYGEADYSERSNPSFEALQLAIEHEGEVVWLTSAPRSSHDEYDVYHEACEAVMIKCLKKRLFHTM